jgi:D-alanine transaminase
MALAQQDQIKIEERAFSLREAYEADEACITAASNFIMPVVEIDGHKIGNGKPGPIVSRLRELYIKEALNTAI